MSGCLFGFALQKGDVVANSRCRDKASPALMNGPQATGPELFVDHGAAHAEHSHDVLDAVQLQGGRGFGGHAAPPSMPRRRGVSVTSVTSSFSQVNPVTGCWLSRIDPCRELSWALLLSRVDL